MTQSHLVKEIKSATNKIYKEVLGYRRHLHQHPELSFQEKNTSKYIKSILDKYGIDYSDGYCKYGIVAEIKGKKKGKIIYLRGDMDALPIKEANKVSYKSTIDGVMHACGHDVHTSCILGAAIILQSIKENIRGTYRILFQPGEERMPGGASVMIKEGAIKNASKSSIIGQHVHPPLEVGKVGFRAGQYMASADELYLEIIGRGGHGALPLDFIDPVMISAQVITALQSVVSRYSDPKIPAVLSFGKINSDGGATNVIPNKVTIHGTLRTMDETNRARLKKAIKDIATHTCKAYGAKAKVKIVHGYPCLVNDAPLTHQCIDVAKEYMGEKNVVLLDKRMTAEDFSYYSQMMPACFYRLGTGNEKKGITSPVHTSTFDIDEGALKTGVGMMTYLAVRYCGN